MAKASISTEQIVRAVAKIDPNGFREALFDVSTQAARVLTNAVTSKGTTPTAEHQAKMNEFMDLALIGKLIENGVLPIKVV